LLSFGVPLLDEQEPLPERLCRLDRFTDNPAQPPAEFVFVNDGSGNRTAEILKRAEALTPATGRKVMICCPETA